MKQYIIEKKLLMDDNVVVIELRPRSPNQTLHFMSGQYVALRFRRGAKQTPARCFSITCPPNEEGKISIAFRKAGAFTTAFSEAAVSETVDVYGPFGEFTVSPDEQRPLLFLAGGIGITPFLSLLANASEHHAQQSITLLYSCRNLRDIPFTSELMELARNNNRITVRFLVGASNPQLKTHPLIIEGKLTSDVIHQFSSTDTQYYICGPAGYSALCQQILAEDEIVPRSIHNEAFSQSSKMTIAGFALQKMVYALCVSAILFGALLFFMKDSLKTRVATSTLQQTATPSQTVPSSTTTTSPGLSSSTAAASPTNASTATPSTASSSQPYQSPISGAS